MECVGVWGWEGVGWGVERGKGGGGFLSVEGLLIGCFCKSRYRVHVLWFTCATGLYVMASVHKVNRDS